MSEFASVDAVARRYACRPGCRSVSAQEVGIAVFVMDLRVILVEPKEIPPIDEFLLRAISFSVGDPKELSRFLGLDSRTVSNRLVELRRAELIELDPIGPAGEVSCRLTIKGRSAADSLEHAELSEKTVPGVVYHGFLRKPLFMNTRQLLKPRELGDRSLRAIPAIPNRAPRPEEIRLGELAGVIRQYWAERRKGKPPELVSVRSVLKDVKTMYQSAVLLQYEPVGRKNQPQFAFAIDGIMQDEYEQAFSGCKGPERIPDLVEKRYKTTAALASEFMKPHLVQALGPLGDVDELQEKIDSLEGVLTDGQAMVEVEDRPDTRQRQREELERLRAEKVDLEKKQAQRKARRLRTHDCNMILASTLAEVKERLVIVSAFLSKEVVDADFLQKLQAASARGVRIWIAYGMGGHGRKDRERIESEDWAEAEKDLLKLQRLFPATFQLKDLGNTHEKILLRDKDFVISGSFNWLSFRGDNSRRYRREDALQVTEPAVIEEYFTEITGQFRKKAKN
jgi:hypothetical protein